MKIREFLLSTGNMPNLKGFNCLVRAVEIIKKDKTANMSKVIYPTLAKEFGYTIPSVERAMRHIINNRIKMDAFKKIGLNKRPTTKELLYYFAEVLDK